MTEINKQDYPEWSTNNTKDNNTKENNTKNNNTYNRERDLLEGAEIEEELKEYIGEPFGEHNYPKKYSEKKSNRIGKNWFD